MKTHNRIASLVAMLVVSPTFAIAQVGWNHDPASEIGTDKWGEITPAFRTCGAIVDGPAFEETGKKQTPIDIVNAEKDWLPALLPAYRNRSLVVENNGHVIEVPYEDEKSPSRLIVGFDVYELLQFHFHAPSEHTVNGTGAAMELHLVHRDKLGNLAVVGVLLKVGPRPNPFIDSIMKNAPEEEGETHVGSDINVRNLLPKKLKYYTYSGSLTTPPCSEGVRWFVLKDPVNVSAAAVARLHELIAMFPEYDGFADNNRPVRPLNNRPILESN